MSMDTSYSEIFQRQLSLLGNDAIEVLQQSHVAVCGLGGVGSFVAESLARVGIGQLTIVDYDTVAVSNLNRQLCALHSTIGMQKTAVVAARILDINPFCTVNVQPVRIDLENVKNLVEHADYIVDAVDDIKAKIALIQYAQRRNVPIISAMGAARRLDPTKLKIADIYETHTCPLAKAVRKELRKLGINGRLKVAFSEETSLPAIYSRSAESTPVLGSMVFVPASMGLLIAAEVVQDMLKQRSIAYGSL